MSQIIKPSAGGAIVNPNNVYVPLGYGTGGGTSLTSGGTNTKGTAVTIGTTTNALAGFFLDLGMGSASGARYLVDLKFDAGSTWHVPDVYVAPGTTGSYGRIFIPLNVAAGSTITARIQSSTASATLNVAVEGIERNSASLPLFNTMTALNADTTNTRASTVNIPLTNSYVELVPSTAAAYGFILGIMGDNGTLPTTAQPASGAIGVGGSGSEVEIVRWGMQIGTTTPVLRNSSSPSTFRTITSGSRLTGRAQAGTTGDNLRLGLYGFGS